MDIKDLNKKQLILLTLLITFVVSIATGIVTVSLMNQMPKSVPQTINNIIQRTIEKVTTVEVPVAEKKTINTEIKTDSNTLSFQGGDTLVSIYLKDTIMSTEKKADGSVDSSADSSIGSGIIISDVGLILVDSSILTNGDMYKVVLDKTEFNASILKKFTNGFTILKISQIKDTSTTQDVVSETTIPTVTQ